MSSKSEYDFFSSDANKDPVTTAEVSESGEAGAAGQPGGAGEVTEDDPQGMLFQVEEMESEPSELFDGPPPFEEAAPEPAAAPEPEPSEVEAEADEGAAAVEPAGLLVPIVVASAGAAAGLLVWLLGGGALLGIAIFVAGGVGGILSKVLRRP